MAKNKRIFISFAVEDKIYRDLLVGQARNNKSPFEFVDMSVKQPWDSSWKTNCRTRIKGCDGLIALISTNTPFAEGAKWEIKCAEEENIPILGIYCNSTDKPVRIPAEMKGHRLWNWTWSNISTFLDSL